MASKFDQWYKINEMHFHNGHYTPKEIARAAWDESRADNSNGECNCHIRRATGATHWRCPIHGHNLDVINVEQNVDVVEGTLVGIKL